MDDNANMKNEIISIYNSIKQCIPNDKISNEKININQDVNTLDCNTLINYIKEFIPLLINQSKDNKELQTHYFQLENQLIKLDIDNKYYLRNFMKYKILKDALEMKLNAYIGLEEEYEELKEKVKYEGGKFLENDRKDNEIIILRRENSTLKKEIAKLEKKNKKNQKKNKEYTTQIKDYESTIESLNKKITNLEKSLKEYTTKANDFNKNLHHNNSCTNIGNINNESSLIKLDNNSTINGNFNYSFKNIKNIHNPNNNHLVNFLSPKYDILGIEPHKNQNSIKKNTNSINTNLFNITYNQIMNKINKKKVKLPSKNDFNILKHTRNNSISVIRGENDENKSFLMNKIMGDKNDKYYSLNKPGNKTRNLNKIMNHKPQNIYPLTSKNVKHMHIIPKHIQKDFLSNKINNGSS